MGEDEFGELRHQAGDVGEGAAGFCPGLGQGPKPGHVDVSVPHREEIHAQGGACAQHALPQDVEGLGDAGVKAHATRFTDIQPFERLIQRVEQMVTGRLVVIEDARCPQGHPGQSQERARWFIHHRQKALAHDHRAARGDIRLGIEAQSLRAARPTHQCQLMFLTIVEIPGQHHLPMMAIHCGVTLAVDEKQGLGMRKIARFADVDDQCDGRCLPIGRDAEGGLEQKMLIRPRPHTAWMDDDARGSGQRLVARGIQQVIGKKRQRLALSINPGFDQGQSLF